MPHSPYIREL